jgi:tetratricopeptide (TPR) repeat protein
MFGAFVFTLFLSWVQVSSDTYIVKSSAGEERAKRVLKELEGFHQLVGTTLVFRNTELPELPIEVLLIGDEQTMKELEPEYNGRKVAVAGYYQAGRDRDFIVLSGRVFPETLTSIVYHELTHYFIARGLRSHPTWLNEGLAEYFSTAEIRDDEISLGGLSLDRLQLLKTSSLLSLKDFFAVDSSSPYYNESSKASVYYAQAWAFMHYLMHGEHASRFKEYLRALQKGDASLLQYLNVADRDLDLGFQNYLKVFMQRSTRNVVKVSGEGRDMQMESIPDTDAQMSMAEIFLANGKLAEARRHLELLAEQAPNSTRVSYYRGILARMDGDSAAREFFVDALLDPFLAPRAAVQLVSMGDIHIPSVRSILEEAAAMQTRNPDVYLALTKIYGEEVRQIEEAVRLNEKREAPVVSVPAVQDAQGELAPEWHSYMRGSARNLSYELLADSSREPRVNGVVAPYYPTDLIADKISGEVVLDVQVAYDGKVGGIWVVSAMPELFGNLAATAVRDWEFERTPAKIRVVLKFTP